MEVLSWSWRPHLMWAESAQQEAEERNWWLWLLYSGTKNNRMTKDRKAEEKGKTKNWERLKGSLKAILKPLIGDICGCLVVRLPLPLPTQGVQFQSLVRELRFHMPQGQKTKTGAILWQIHLKMTHIKKKKKLYKKIPLNVHFQRMNFMVHKLYFNKAVIRTLCWKPRLWPQTYFKCRKGMVFL